MTRFSDPLATRVVQIGPCQCPNQPHEQDEATIRYQLGASGLARIGRAELEGAIRLDPMAAYRQTVLETIESWNLLWPGAPDKDGIRPIVPVPVTAQAIELLDVDTLKFLAETADKLIQDGGQLPNASGAPSVESSPESASPTPKPSRKPTT